MKTVREKLKKIVSFVLCGATALSLVGTGGAEALSGAVTAWAAEAEGLDPVGTDAEYIGENLDSAYITATGEARLVNAAIVHQRNYGYDDVDYDPDNAYTTTAAVYDFGSGNAYLAAYVGIIPSTANDTALFRNANGFLVDGCIYDASTGIAYMPREFFKDDDGNYAYLNVQAYVQPAADWTGETVNVSVTVDGNTEVRVLESNDDVGNITLDTGLNADAQIAVFVNGILSDGYLWDYDAESGSLTLDLAAAQTSDITVKTGKKSEINALKEAYGEMYVYSEHMSERMDELMAMSEEEVEAMVEESEAEINTMIQEAMDEGRIPSLSLASAGDTVQVTIKKSSSYYEYGTHKTHIYTVTNCSDGDVYAYCCDPVYDAVSSGTYTATETAASSKIRRVLYYCYGGPGADNSTYGINALVSALSAQVKAELNKSGEMTYVASHLIASYAYLSTFNTSDIDDTFEGLSEPTIEAIDAMYVTMTSNAAYAQIPNDFVAYYINTSTSSGQPLGFATSSSFDTPGGDEPEYGYLQVYKDVDSSGVEGFSLDDYPVTGAVYTVYSDSSCSSSSSVGTLTVGSNGYSETLKVETGTYYVKETTAPTCGKYNLDTTTHTATVTTSHTSSNPFTVTSTETPTTGPAYVVKTSSNATVVSGNDNYSLEGAEYGVYRTLSDAADDTNRVTTLTTLSSGNSNTAQLVVGTYYVKEITASKGYELDRERYFSDSYPGIQQITVAAGNTTEVDSVEEPKLDPATITLTKIDANTGASVAEGAASLEGARFTIKFYAVDVSTYTSADSVSGLDPTRTWVIQTKKDRSTGEYVAKLDAEHLVSGTLYYSEDGSLVLPMGVLTITETLAPEGYSTDGMYYVNAGDSTDITYGDTWFGVVAEDGDDVDLIGGNEYCVEEPPIMGGVTVAKYDERWNESEPEGDASLEGATFAIINESENSVTVKGKSYAKGETVMTIKTALDTDSSSRTYGKYVATTGEKVLPYGSYKVEETGLPTGYKKGTTYSREFSITTDGQMVYLDTVSTGIANPPIAGGVTITKFDAETLKSSPQGDASLAGAKFEIVNESAHSVRVYGTRYAVGDTVLTLTPVWDANLKQ